MTNKREKARKTLRYKLVTVIRKIRKQDVMQVMNYLHEDIMTILAMMLLFAVMFLLPHFFR